MNDFQAFALPQVLTSAIAQMNYTTPTPIQEKVIPLVLDGRDILASSCTGSGKTGAFAIPLIAKILASESDTALILTPTRELATQVMDIVRNLTKNNSAIRTALLIGGDPIDRQYRQLRSSPRIVVGTPGRVNDHLKRRTLKLNNNKYLVLDETDRMLDMGFGIQIDAILEHSPKIRQTLLFSATISKQIEKLSENYLTNPEYVKIGLDRAVAPNITQENINVTEHDKYSTLLKEIGSREGSILVFVKTKHSAQNIANRLSSDDHEALAIHGDLRQRQRDQTMKSFHSQKNRILVATDIASRGLDVPHIEHVINYDPPQMAEDYIHRIGRTARAGRSGCSLNLVSARDGKKWKEISRLLKGGEPEPFVRSNSGSRSGGFGRPRGERPFGNNGFRSNDRFNRDSPRPSHRATGRSEGGFNGDANESRPPREKREWNPSSSFSQNRSSGFGGGGFNGARKPFNKFGDSSKPFERRGFDSSRKPFARTSDDSRKPFERRGFDSPRKPFARTSDDSRKPFSRERGGFSRGFTRQPHGNNERTDRRFLD